MATISLQVVSGNPAVGTKTKTWTYTDAEIDRLLAAWSVGNPGATPTTALTAWADAFMARTISEVLDYESRQAALSVTRLNPT